MWVTPKTDWNTNPKSPMAVDFNRIEGNIAHVLNEIELKKGSLVDAINTKENLVTIESSYAEIANAIGEIQKRPRVKSTMFNQPLQNIAQSGTLHITIPLNLDFTPSKIIIYPVKFNAYNPLGGASFDGVLSNVYTLSGSSSGNIAYLGVTTLDADKCVIRFTVGSNAQGGAVPAQTWTWYAYEQEG